MSDVPTDAVRAALRSQYRSALDMLRDAVEQCPEELWDDGAYTNRFWQVAYHALFFTHLYLQPHLDDFRPWSSHQSGVQHEDGIAGPEDPDSDLPLIPQPYSKSDVLAYCDLCHEMVAEALGALDLASPESGFYWYPVPKLEHQLVNLRHLQHHTAQLIDRLRNQSDVGISWTGSRHDSSAG